MGAACCVESNVYGPNNDDGRLYIWPDKRSRWVQKTIAEVDIRDGGARVGFHFHNDTREVVAEARDVPRILGHLSGFKWCESAASRNLQVVSGVLDKLAVAQFRPPCETEGGEEVLQ